MGRTPIKILPFVTIALTACQSEAERASDATKEQIERQAEQSAAAAGEEIAALGLTERQLLDANLVSEDGSELGDVEQVLRDDSGAVSAFLVEVEDSNPDHYVEVPLAGLTVMEGIFLNDADLQTNKTAQDLASMPDARMSTR